MEYTKGEWGMRGILPIGFHIYSKNTNNPIAVGIENEANARFIAVAPDLYEALERIVMLLVNPLTTRKEPTKTLRLMRAIDEAWQLAEQAIAKVEKG